MAPALTSQNESRGPRAGVGAALAPVMLAGSWRARDRDRLTRSADAARVGRCLGSDTARTDTHTHAPHHTLAHAPHAYNSHTLTHHTHSHTHTLAHSPHTPHTHTHHVHTRKTHLRAAAPPTPSSERPPSAERAEPEARGPRPLQAALSGSVCVFMMSRLHFARPSRRPACPEPHRPPCLPGTGRLGETQASRPGRTRFP